MGDVVHLPTPLTARAERVDQLARAVAHGKAVRPVADAWEADGQVCLEVGDLEVWLSPEDASELASLLATAAAGAMGRRGER